MSAPNNNDGYPPIFRRLHSVPRRTLRASGTPRPGVRLVRRNDSLSSPLNPAQPASQIPTLRPVSLVPPVRPLLTGTRSLLEAQRRVLATHRTMSSPHNSSSSSQTMAQMQALEETSRRIDENERRLTEAIERSNRLLREPIPGLDSMELHPPKRRRLDATPTTEDEKPKIHQVNYGYEGAVVPGKLNMALQYCDGGVFEEGVCCLEHNVPSKEVFGVQNIFKDDKSVYCTKGSRCNIIIQHEGARPFTMKELIIKAPKSGYTSPVREGMVFVGMDIDELMLRTAEYKVQYDKKKQKKRRGTTRYNSDGTLTTDYPPSDFDPVTFAAKDSAAIIPEDFIGEDEGYKVETFCHSDVEPYSSDDELPDDAHPWRSEAHDAFLLERMLARRQALARGRLAGVQQNVGNALWARTQSPYIQGEDYPSSENDDEEEAWAEVRRRDRELRRAQNGYVSSDSEEDEDEESDGDEDEEEDDDENMSTDQADAELEANKDPVDAASAPETNNADHGDALGNAGEPKMLQARARFYICRGKSTCRMVFEPAISARFVLLKLYCPDGGGKRKGSRRGNIDMRNVTVKGWCGPRAFRSTQLR